MNDQLGLFEPAEPTPAAIRAAAIATAEANAPDDWRRAARVAVSAVASRGADFTSDDVLDELAAMRAPTTHTLAALGPVFLAAARAGEIRRTGHLRPSRLPQRHRDLTVWAPVAARGQSIHHQRR